MATAQEVQALLQLINGSGKTTSYNKSVTLTPEQIQAIVTQSLEDQGSGLAAISSGQRSAGARGSSMNAQLVNDLTTRAASSAAAKSYSETGSSQEGSKTNLAKQLMLTGAVGAGLNFLEPVGQATSAAAKGLGQSAVSGLSSLVTGGKSNVAAPSFNLGSGWGETNKLNVFDDADPFADTAFDLSDSFSAYNEFGESGLGAATGSEAFNFNTTNMADTFSTAGSYISDTASGMWDWLTNW
jgi:hypothetical protein